MRLFLEEMHWIIEHLGELDCYNRPDYAKIYGCCEKWMQRLRATNEMPYDWERADQLRADHKKAPAWVQPRAFFTSDPIRLNGPPTNLNENSPPSSDYLI